MTGIECSHVSIISPQHHSSVVVLHRRLHIRGGGGSGLRERSPVRPVQRQEEGPNLLVHCSQSSPVPVCGSGLGVLGNVLNVRRDSFRAFSVSVVEVTYSKRHHQQRSSSHGSSSLTYVLPRNRVVFTHSSQQELLCFTQCTSGLVDADIELTDIRRRQ